MLKKKKAQKETKQNKPSQNNLYQLTIKLYPMSLHFWKELVAVEPFHYIEQIFLYVTLSIQFEIKLKNPFFLSSLTELTGDGKKNWEPELNY